MALFKQVNNELIEMTPEEEAAFEAERAAARAPKVPRAVTPYQARVALLQAGLLKQVETMMLDPNTPEAAKIAWEYATVWERNSAFVATLAPALGLDDAEVDALFLAAGQVT